MNNAALLNVSKLCLGTMTFGEQNSYEDARTQLNLASESGINFFDVAEMYPVPQRAETQGKSEIYVGRWLKEAHVSRDRVVVATKVTTKSLKCVQLYFVYLIISFQRKPSEYGDLYRGINICVVIFTTFRKLACGYVENNVEMFESLGLIFFSLDRYTRGKE